jgi:hypothetical protein
MAIETYRNSATREISEGIRSKNSYKLLPLELHRLAFKKLMFLDTVTTLGELAA